MPRDLSKFPQYANEYRRIRKEAGLTQIVLSKKLGLHVTAISQIERGIAKPSIHLLERTGALLGHNLITKFEKLI